MNHVARIIHLLRYGDAYFGLNAFEWTNKWLQDKQLFIVVYEPIEMSSTQISQLGCPVWLTRGHVTSYMANQPMHEHRPWV